MSDTTSKDINMKNHLSLLGKKAEDKVTTLQGTICSVCFDLYGCIQAAIHPPVDKEGKAPSGRWFDVSRINVTDENPVMRPPAFLFSEGSKPANGETNVRDCLAVLGRNTTNRVTGFKGVCSSVYFDLYGHIQVCCTPSTDKDGKKVDSDWVSLNAVSIDDDEPVMALPNFDFGPEAEGVSGAAEKPAPSDC